MAPCLGDIPKIPKISTEGLLEPKPDHIIVEHKKEDFSGEIEGGTFWQALKVEENLIKNILLHLDPVDLINMEKTCILMRNLIGQNWKCKLLYDFNHLLSNYVIKDKLDRVVNEVDEKYNGDVKKNENWSYKLKYVHCWNLKLNWDKGQFLKTEITERFKPIIDDDDETNDDETSDDDDEDETHTAIEFMYLFNTDFSGISCNEPGQLFCHENKSVTDMGLVDLMNVIEVSHKSMVIIGINEGPKLCAKLVEKKSLKVLADCTCDEEYEDVGMGDTGISVMGNRILVCNEVGGIELFKFQDDPPFISHVKYNSMEHQLLSLPTDWLRQRGKWSEFSGDYCAVTESFKLDLFKADFTGVAQKKKTLYQKVWGLNISNQASLPKVKFTSVMINFPFIFVGKSNGMLELWDVTKDEIVNTVSQADLVNAITRSNPNGSETRIDEIRLNEMGKVCCMSGDHDTLVIDATKFKKCERDSPLGYRMLKNGVGLEMAVDSTCIVMKQVDTLETIGALRYDFWPIFPENFKLKPVKPEEDGIQVKKRSDYLCSAGYGDEFNDSEMDGDCEVMTNV